MQTNRLRNLLVANRGKGRFDLRAAADGSEATIYLYDVIVSDDYWGGVSDKTFIDALNQIEAPTIHLRVNSPGGDVFAARAMEQAIREHSSQIIAHIDGYAASAASYVAIAADKKIIAPGAFYMIHKAWTIGWGNSEDLLKTAALLEKIDGTLADTYAVATGQDREEIMQWMADETWFTGQEAVDAGFADELATDGSGKSQENAGASAWDLTAYQHAPEARPAPDPDPEPEQQTDYTAAHHAHMKRQVALVA